MVSSLQPATAQGSLQVVYPPREHTTSAPQIFFIGTAPPQVVVTLNGRVIGDRSPAGHFAPRLPLQPGLNHITLQAGDQRLDFAITRTVPQVPTTLQPLEPTADLVRLANEIVCFTAAAPSDRAVQVQVGQRILPLEPLPPQVQLPSNLAALIHQADVVTARPSLYRNCLQLTEVGDYGPIQWQLGNQRQLGARIRVAEPTQLPVVEVTRSLGGVARTGPSTDYSRLTPLPVGTRARVRGQTGDWLHLDYGGWIRANEVRFLSSALPTTATIRSITSRQLAGWTEISFPLDVPVPISIQQGDRQFTLTLHNTIPQTDIIRLNADPVIQRLDWYPLDQDRVEYRLTLHHRQQWGYRVAYEGNRLVLQLRHPPQLQRGTQPLRGIKILLDPGHGGPEDLGARGPDGTPEKVVTLALAQKLAPELERLGATVILTRTEDIDLDLPDRLLAIESAQPTLALSLHYNALPDAGDARNTQGIGTFWYHPQSHDLAVFLEGYLSQRLRRQQYGVFWNNLALTRPTIAPAVLLELGFMIHPEEFEWIVNPQAQAELAHTLAQGILEWLQQATRD
ncbi:MULTISPECIES: N-acetylmuramoyl-L-alanine amidase [unclassified Thermosynechococcus]|uniref:N-acetylmuramoyl-L-alanine amidase n=1 Tax=unclassified Thermosynechococcus TaxID=2622553 RepID=UPI0026724993|nr:MULTISPECIES: N-acetylmuramoyl-L-alanine amidase [unclassified Thermosynechococcus]WKT82657.1 N-acetylmuramoyl-L-alanine amidase [Thermosynechococcus sp. HY596]WNC61783.1 N-acetylmuramoyl-L-alanine amidase [Thermosynechococcus sp. HY591]WNC64338.1 N-acetylmuramoyl-L-alanine amidase [Thermosynechococcus sp. HY593]